jgi:hypothetical protein
LDRTQARDTAGDHLMSRLRGLAVTITALLAVGGCAAPKHQMTFPAPAQLSTSTIAPSSTILLPDEYGQFGCQSLVTDNEVANLLGVPGMTLQPVGAVANGQTDCMFGPPAAIYSTLAISVLTRPSAFRTAADVNGRAVAGLGRWAVLRITPVGTAEVESTDLYVGGQCNQLDVALYAGPNRIAVPTPAIAAVFALARLVFGRIDCSPAASSPRSTAGAMSTISS